MKDTVNGFVEIAKSDKTVGQEINIASGIEISIGQLAGELIAQVNRDAKIVCEPARLRPEKSEVERLLGCNRKLLSLTAWKPQFSLAQGLAETIFLPHRSVLVYMMNFFLTHVVLFSLSELYLF